MTWDRRKEILAKEYISTDDICELYDFTKPQASDLLCKIKRKLTIKMKRELRLDMRGRIHTQDYLDALGITSDRYSIAMDKDVDMESNKKKVI